MNPSSLAYSSNSTFNPFIQTSLQPPEIPQRHPNDQSPIESGQLLSHSSIAASQQNSSTSPLAVRQNTRKRESNYSTQEDSAIARAWLRVSEDLIIGLEQKYLDFYSRVADISSHFKPPTMDPRSVESLKARVR